jgi:hypothetical protein
LLLILFAAAASAQTGAVDSAGVKQTRISTDSTRSLRQPLLQQQPEPHSPRKATMRSLMLPGWGQAYNKKYWKIPVIYIGAAALIYGLQWNHNQYKDFKQLAVFINDGDSNTIPAYNGRILNSGYSNWAAGNRDYFRKNRDLCAIGLVAVYVLNVIDANVDAHLFEFNITDDVSLRLEPNLWTQQNQMYAGIGATFKLK